MGIYPEQNLGELYQAINDYKAWEAEQEPNVKNSGFAHGANEALTRRVTPTPLADTEMGRTAIEQGFAFGYQIESSARSSE
jgi:hypothetical protein